MGSRERVIWVVLPAAAVVLAVVGVSISLGYMCSRSELRQLRHQNQALELELEERLASGEGPPEDAATETDGAPDSEAEADAGPAPDSEPDPQAVQALARVDALEGQLAELGREKERLARQLSALRKKNQKLDADLRSARQKRDRAERDLAALRRSLDSVASEPRPAPNPAKAEPAPAPVDAAAAPPAAASDVSAARCAPLEQSVWEIAEAGGSLNRLDGALAIQAHRESDGALTLQIGDERAPRQLLAEPPQHFSWSCGSTDYVVSVCAAEERPFRVAGRIWEAGDRWPDPCGR